MRYNETPVILQVNPRANYLAWKEEIDAALMRVASGGQYIRGPELDAFERGCSIRMFHHSSWVHFWFRHAEPDHIRISIPGMHCCDRRKKPKAKRISCAIRRRFRHLLRHRSTDRTVTLYSEWDPVWRSATVYGL